MSHFTVIAVPRPTPDLDRVVAALLALAISELEREQQAKAGVSETKEEERG